MQNTEKRIYELSDCIDKALKAGTLTALDSQVWPAPSKVCLKQVTLHAYGSESDKIHEPCWQPYSIHFQQGSQYWETQGDCFWNKQTIVHLHGCKF